MKTRMMRLLMGFFALAGHVLADAWYDTAWPFRQPITISRALATATLTNFPVLVRIGVPTNGVFMAARADGADIVFTAGDQVTKLAHELDSYTAAGATRILNAWVSIPEFSASEDTVLFMYYGNPAAADQQNAAAVWQDYRGVWHLDEDAAGASGDWIYPDSTGNGFDGQDTVATAAGEGRIGRAAYLNGVSDEIPLSATLFTTNDFTISAWAKPTDTVMNAETLVGGLVSGQASYLSIRTNSSLFGRSYCTASGTYTVYGDNADFTPGAWHHVVFRSTGRAGAGQRTLCVDTLMVNAGADTILTPPLGADAWAYLGAYAPNAACFGGALDEIRIADQFQSDAFLAAEYRTAANPESYLTIGNEQNLTPWHARRFPRRRLIRLSESVADSDLVDFPYPIVITNADDDVFMNAAADGHDILFTAGDGVTELAHEIERFSAAGNPELCAWVKVPRLNGGAPTLLYMYYGRAGAPAQENPAGVWTENYLAVWHLDEADSAYTDSTGNGYHGADHVSAAGKSGIIGAGQEFDGVDDYISFANVSTPRPYTVSVWMKTDAVNYRMMIGGGGHYIGLHYSGGSDITNFITRSLYTGSTAGTVYSQTVPVQPDQWWQVALVCADADGASRDVVVNGQVWTSTQNATVRPVNAVLWNLIGNYATTATATFFDGCLDEIRISSTNRSVDWLAAEYRSIRNPLDYLLLGTAETLTPSGSLILLR